MDEILGKDVIKEPEVVLDAPPNPKIEEVKKSPDQLMTEALSDYPFLKFSNGTLNVTHPELTQYLKPKILKMGDIVKRGTILSNLNGGILNVDAQTQSLNSCLATISVGFVDVPKLNLLEVEDTDLIMALYVAVVSFQNFFRKSTLGFTL